MQYFTEQCRNQLLSTRDELEKRLQSVSDTLSDEMIAFDGLALFYQDINNPQRAGVIANAPNQGHDRQLEYPIDNRYVDLSISTVGKTFDDGIYQLEPSQLNPSQHNVAGYYLAEEEHHGASVLQAAFITDKDVQPTPSELSIVHSRLKAVAPHCKDLLSDLQQQARVFPAESLLDALELDIPSTPNAFSLVWDTSHSRAQALENYGKLRADLTVRGHIFQDIITQHGGRLLGFTGDGQVYSLEIPPEYRLSKDSIQQYAGEMLVPAITELLDIARHDHKPPIRLTVDIGYIEDTHLGKNSPILFDSATTSDKQPHDRTTVAFGSAALATLQLDKEVFERLNA